MLRFFFGRAAADKLLAAGATRAVFVGDGLGQVDIGDIRQGGEPGGDVGELAGQFIRGTFAECGGQFADFFHKPHERTRDPAFVVFGAVHLGDQVLEIAKGDGTWYGRQDRRWRGFWHG